jgi:glycosyl transferase family 25
MNPPRPTRAAREHSRTPDVFAAFDAIAIINLRERTDRRAEMEGELARVGLTGDPRVRFFDAIAPTERGTFTSRGARGVFLSHLALLKASASANESLLILEDDADFTPAVWEFAMPGRWDVFYGGHYASDEADLHNSDIIGAHCMGFTADTAKRLAPFVEDLLLRSDHPPIDGAYVWFRRRHPDLATVFAQPAIAEQRPSRTDIADQAWFDRTPFVRTAAAIARKLKRTRRRWSRVE